MRHWLDGGTKGLPQIAGRYAAHRRARWHVARDDRARRDGGARTNRHARQDGGADPDEGAVSDLHLAAQARARVGTALGGALVGPGGGRAQRAVRAALLMASGVRLIPPGQRGDGLGTTAPGPAPGSAVYLAAARFAAMPAAARHGWLSTHLLALRAGRIALRQLP